MQAWDSFLKTLAAELGDEAVQKWLRPLKVIHFDACNLYLEAENTFQIDWFEEHIRPKACRKFLNANFRLIKIHLTSSTDLSPSKGKITVSPPPESSPFVIIKDLLFPEYQIGSFVFNSSNEILFELFSKLVASQDSAFNPVFLYGTAATGKTHFLQALAHEMQKMGRNALYVKVETFTENCVKAIRSSAMQDFRKAYRHVDTLLVDDVQQLANKTTTQEEFFHTFNALHSLGKQIVLCSATAPSLLTGIEPRLTSRFEWGLCLPIAKLDREDLMLVIKNRCNQLGLTLSEPSLFFILETFSCKLPSIQRAFEALYLRTLEKKQVLTLSVMESILKDLIKQEQSFVLTPDKLLTYVADFYGIQPKEILSKSQTQECTTPRQIAMFFCRKNLKMPFTKIGQYFQRDHSTVMTSVKAVEEKLTTGESDTKIAWMKIKQKIEQATNC